MVNLHEIAGIMCQTGVVSPCLIFSLALMLDVTFSGQYSSEPAFDDQTPANSGALPVMEPEHAT
ncbi:MAG: hypothetical protein CVV41_02765 [Candidatus Riflebacteria bacterium HGW-Riflebacteria-1]|jgi:hypothetical protein|nr:MAG: hypothetical protein CVV41_02765 [Candidatus Riflebacteria bacterium HGW-Riflebacteria-1]